MNKNLVNSVAVFVFFYILLGIPSVYYIVNTIITDYYQQIGQSGIAILNDALQDVKVTDADILRLKKLPHEELASDPINERIKQVFTRVCNIIQARYVYLVTTLEPNEIIESVDSSPDHETQIPLNAMLLLHVVYEKPNQSGQNGYKSHYEYIKGRFVHMHKQEREMYEQKECMYFYAETSAGEQYISSQIPFYTVEGSFAGMLGLDIFHDEYLGFVEKLKIYFIIAPLIILILILFLGITHLRSKEKGTLLEVISQKIVIDTLTGIYNRNGLEDFEKNRFSRLKEAGHLITVIMMDVDDFKNVNDSCGHSAGDEVLLGIAKIIHENVRMPDDYPIRLGGDEFMVIFTNISRDAVISVANRLIRTIHATKFLSDNINVSVSIGVSSLSDKNDNKTLSDLMKEADLALYAGKRSTKNIVVPYEEIMSEQAEV